MKWNDKSNIRAWESDTRLWNTTITLVVALTLKFVLLIYRLGDSTSFGSLAGVAHQLQNNVGVLYDKLNVNRNLI